MEHEAVREKMRGVGTITASIWTFVGAFIE